MFMSLDYIKDMYKINKLLVNILHVLTCKLNISQPMQINFLFKLIRLCESIIFYVLNFIGSAQFLISYLFI